MSGRIGVLKYEVGKNMTIESSNLLTGGASSSFVAGQLHTYSPVSRFESFVDS